MIKKFNLIFKILIFLTASIITVFLFPDSKKFSYEYQKGEPWKHKNLIAENDFPIYKSDLVLQQEKDSILKNLNPYFIFKKDIKQKYINKFNNNYNTLINNLVEQSDDKKEIESLKKNYNITRKQFLKELNNIYDKGIIEPANVYSDNDVKSANIFILKDNIAEIHNYNELISQKEAYNKLNKLYVEIKDNSNFIIPDIDFMNYIEYNVVYDVKKTISFRR